MLKQKETSVPVLIHSSTHGQADWKTRLCGPVSAEADQILRNPCNLLFPAPASPKYPEMIAKCAGKGDTVPACMMSLPIYC